MLSDDTADVSGSLFERVVITSPLTVTPETSVVDTINQMHQARSSYALVVNEKKTEQAASLAGVFTERDLVRAVASEYPFDDILTGSAMTKSLPKIAVKDISSVSNLSSLMRQQQTDYLAVIDKRGQLAGIITKKSLRGALSASSLLKFKTVAEVMVQQVVCLSQSSSVFKAAQLMANQNISCVVILEENELPVGIVTERDVVQFKALNLDVHNTRLEQVMSTPLLPVHSQDSLWSANQKMSQHRVRRLVVRSSDEQLAGIVTQTSILQALSAEDHQQMIELLQQEVLQLRSENQTLLEARNRELERTKIYLSTQLEDKQIEQQQTQAQLKATYQQLEESNRALTQTNRELSHTLRELQSAEQALQQTNAELESRVETRTLDFRQAERRWRSLLEDVHLVVIGLDLDGKVNYANPFFLRLAGYSADEVLEKHWFRDFVLEADYERTYQYFQELVDERGASLRYQNAILTRSGVQRLIDWNNTVLRDRNNQIVGTMSIGEDITDKLAIDRMKGEFVSVVSHELRTPLTAIHGSLQLITSGLVASNSAQGRGLLQVAAESSLRLVRLVNDILELERLESGKVRLNRTGVNSQQAVRQAVRRFETAAIEKEIEIAISGPELWVYADGDRLIQVLTNLIDNAIKFSPEGATIWLSVELASESAGEHYEEIGVSTDVCEEAKALVLFKVKDQGRGIPFENLSNIFERFTQINYSDARQKGGTGLGLATCHNIIRQHGGRIWAESKLGEGSSFLFTLPLFKHSSAI